MFARRRRERCYRRLGSAAVARHETKRRIITEILTSRTDPPYRTSVPAACHSVPGLLLRRWTEINSAALWQSVKVNRGTPGRNPRSVQIFPNHLASTPYTARYRFTSENRTIANVSCFNIGTATTPVSHVPFRPLLHSKSAIWLNGCDNKRPWLPDFGRSAIKPWRRRSFQRSNRTVLSSG